MLFSHGSGQQQIEDNKKCRRITGDFDGHGDAAVRREVYCLMEHIQDSLKATGRIRRLPWSTISNKTHNTLTKHNF